MNPQRDTLSEALRELAAASPQASPQLGVSLSSAFARHHVQRRRRNRVAFAIGLAACLAISAVWLRAGKLTNAVKVVEHASQTAKAPPLVSEAVAPESPKGPKIPAPSLASTGVKPRVGTRQVSKSRSRSLATPPATVQAGDFVALPTFDPAIPVGQSRMVRIDLPGSDLQLIGYPVDGQLLDRRIVTDVLVGQDGMPYAVRLVQTRNAH